MHLAGTEVAPTATGAFFEEAKRRIDRERLRRDFEHGEIMEGIAKDGVGVWEADAAKRLGFGLIRRNVDEVGGDDAVGDFDFGGEYTIFRDAELSNAFRNHPLVGGANCP